MGWARQEGGQASESAISAAKVNHMVEACIGPVKCAVTLSDPVEMRMGYNRLADEFIHAAEMLNTQMCALRLAHSPDAPDEDIPAWEQVRQDPALRKMSLQLCTLDALANVAQRLASGMDMADVVRDTLQEQGSDASYFAASVARKNDTPEILVLANTDNARLYMQQRVRREFLWITGVLAENARRTAAILGSADYARDTGDDALGTVYAEACGGIYGHVVKNLQKAICASSAPRVLKPSDYTLLS